eukprot:TRINITY_DN14628_c0_g1_i1.p4 TRINITY_DN14628_c0_g1~~TRINITY_DN14628_c0_g1_i1.p4  ORF type:complete len:173 (+),score=43.63 TRINITY_DN14628_c0_g1_i1:116-634(+)
MDEVKSLLKTRNNNFAEFYKELQQPVQNTQSIKIPDNFDARKDWPDCIHPILNQGSCGSCWAFGATETVSDRYCIKGKDVILSPQDLVSCDPLDKGCLGGGDVTPYLYLMSPGAVTESCFPYTSGAWPTPPCITKCEDGKPFVKYGCKPGSCLLYTSPSPRDLSTSRMPSSA